jgi:mRNA interferase RelE/StbE
VNVGFRESFTKDLAAIKNKSLLKRVRSAVEAVEKAESLDQIHGLKKLKGGGGYYRLRIGDYRIGLALEHGKVIFARFINRKEIYRYFP